MINLQLFNAKQLYNLLCLSDVSFVGDYDQLERWQ